MSASLSGLFPQGFSFMAILELSAGASLAPRLWWGERALGIALVSAGLATAAPAYADQTLLVADNGTVRCEASAKDLTRISLKDDQFASVSKVQAPNPADDFQVVNEPLRGDIYLSVANGFSKPTISFFGTTRKGFVYKFICAVGGSDARQVFIANADVEHPRPVGETWPAGLSAQDASARLIAAMYAQKPVEGFEVTWRALVPVNIDALVVQMVGQYVGASYTGKLIKITNRGTKPAALTEDKVAPADAIGGRRAHRRHPDLDHLRCAGGGLRIPDHQLCLAPHRREAARMGLATHPGWRSLQQAGALSARSAAQRCLDLARHGWPFPSAPVPRAVRRGCWCGIGRRYRDPACRARWHHLGARLDQCQNPDFQPDRADPLHRRCGLPGHWRWR